MTVRNLYKMVWFHKAAKQQLAWLRKNNGDAGLICAFQEIVKDYEYNIADIQKEYANAAV